MMSGINGQSSYSNVYMNQQRPPAPKLDTGNDESIDLEDLEDFSQKEAESVGTTFDTQEVMSQHNANSDGLIDKTEGLALQEENSFNLPSPEELQAQMMAEGGNRPQSPPPSGGIPAGASNENSDSTIELLESLTDSDTTYSAAEIALYDTNGDGEIDSSEEAAMKALKASSTDDNSLNKTQDPFMATMNKAINAYTQSLTQSSTTQSTV